MSAELDRLRALFDRWDEVVEEVPCPICAGSGVEPGWWPGSRDLCSECDGDETAPVLGAEKVRLVLPALLAVARVGLRPDMPENAGGFTCRCCGSLLRLGHAQGCAAEALRAAINEHVPADPAEPEGSEER